MMIKLYKTSTLSLILLWNIIPTLIFTMSLLIIMKDVLNNGYSFRTITFPNESSQSTDGTSYKLLANKPVSQQFKAERNYLGIITVKFDKANVVRDALTFSLREVGQNNYIYVGEMSAVHMAKLPNFPFGFPEIADSQGKEYEFSLVSKSGTPENSLSIDMNENYYSSSYQIPASDILRSGGTLIDHLYSKFKLAIQSKVTLLKICFYFSLTILYALTIYYMISLYERNIEVIRLPIVNSNFKIEWKHVGEKSSGKNPMNLYFHTVLSQYYLILVPISLLINWPFFYYVLFFLLLTFSYRNEIKNAHFLSVQIILIILGGLLLSFRMDNYAAILFTYTFMTTLFLVLYVCLKPVREYLQVVLHQMSRYRLIRKIEGYFDYIPRIGHSLIAFLKNSVNRVAQSTYLSTPALYVCRLASSSNRTARTAGLAIVSTLIVLQTGLILFIFAYFVSFNYSFMTFLQTRIN